MKKMTALLAAGLVSSAAFVAGCGGQQSQAPQTDDEQPETVIVYRDSDDGNSSGDENSGEATTPDTQSSSSSSGGSSGSSTTDDDADDNMRSTDQIPDGFPVPVPDDYQVERVGTTDREFAVDLSTPSGQEAYDFYEQTLADEGFDIEEAEIDRDEGRFDANIDFRNSEYDGDIDFNGDFLEMDVEILNPAASSGGSDDSGSSGGSSASLPSGFPVSIPDDYEIRDVREGTAGDDLSYIDVTLDAPDGRAAFDYYAQNLEADGFTVEETDIDNDSTDFDGDIDFNGAGFEGNVDVTGNTVEIDLDSNLNDD